MALRFGKISKTDPEKGLAKVSFDEDDMETAWLPVGQKKTQGDKHFHMMDVGEHVACMMDEHAENGVIVCAVYSKDENPGSDVKGAGIEGVQFADGTKIFYNAGSGKLTVDAVGDVFVKSATKVIIEAPDVEITADVKITGTLDVTGIIKSDTEVEAGPLPIALTTHKHVGVTPGPGTTGLPTP